MGKGKGRWKREKIRGKLKRKGENSEIRKFLTSMETKNVLLVKFSRSAVIPL